jgi:hypothetical protein
VVRENIGQDSMMVSRFQGYYLDKDRLLRYNYHIYILPNEELKSLNLIKAHRAVYMAHLGAHED